MDGSFSQQDQSPTAVPNTSHARKVPSAMLQSLRSLPDWKESIFLSAQQQIPPTSVRVHPIRSSWDLSPKRSDVNFFDSSFVVTKVPWCETGFYIDPRPSFIADPFFHGGAYYVQEASSMAIAFAFQALQKMNQAVDQPLVLDLCAAPGGKSTVLLEEMKGEGLLISNEVIKQRVTVLEENISKWGYRNVMVTSADPKSFQQVPHLFDGILVDAPCTGSGLWRKEPEAIDEWSEEAVGLCAGRQKRILADIWPCLQPGGWLMYATCSFSPEENEEVTDFVLQELPDAAACPISFPPEWGITQVFSPKNNGSGYRFQPHLLKGEGFYLSCFHKKSISETDAIASTKYSREQFPHSSNKGKFSSTATPSSKKKSNSSSGFNDKKNEAVILSELLNSLFVPMHQGNPERLAFMQYEDLYWAVPEEWKNTMEDFKQKMQIKKAGILIGKWLGSGSAKQKKGTDKLTPLELFFKEWVPDQDLAHSLHLSQEVPRWNLSLTQAQKYLRKEDFSDEPPFQGWGLVAYQGIPLGWVKVIQKRINNYFPKNRRILKQL